jgi:integrase/recombinase XerD
MVSLNQVAEDLKGCFLDEIDKVTISGLVKRRRRGGASNATVRRDLVAVSSVLGFCEDEGWIDRNPALPQLKRMKERRDPIVLPEHDHIRFVIGRAPGLLAKLIEAALNTGCRQDELVLLQRSRLDYGRRQFTVLGKGNKQRTLDMLDAYPVFAAAPAYATGKYVFWHGAGLPYRNVASRFAAITESAQKSAHAEGREFRRFRFHDLRHRFAVDFLKDGRGTIYDLQQHLGHRSVKTTEIYLQFLTPEEAQNAKHGSAQKTAQR